MQMSLQRDPVNRKELLPFAAVVVFCILLLAELLRVDLESIYVWDYAQEEMEETVSLTGKQAELTLSPVRSTVQQLKLYFLAEDVEETSGEYEEEKWINVVLYADGKAVEAWGICPFDAAFSETDTGGKDVQVVTLELYEPLTDGLDQQLTLCLYGDDLTQELALSGYALLYGSISRRTLYLILGAAMVLLMGGALLAGTRFGRGLKEEQRYLLLAVPAGLFFILLFPYTNSTDDLYHFARIWDILQGNILSEKIGDAVSGYSVGGYLPGNLWAGLEFTSGYREIFMALEQKVDYGAEQWYYFANTALYSPVAYLPQALGVCLTSLLTDYVLVIEAGGRLAGYLFSTVLVYHAIRLMPCRKQLLTLIALTPMFVMEAAAGGADCFVDAVLVFYCAYILHFVYGDAAAGRRDAVLLTVLSFCVAMCKIVYLPFCLLLFLIPKERFGKNTSLPGQDRRGAGGVTASAEGVPAPEDGFAGAGGQVRKPMRDGKRKALFCWGNLVFAAVCNLGWTALVSGFVDYFAKGGVDSSAQVLLVLTHPWRYIMVMYRTAIAYAEGFMYGSFGNGIGLNVSVNNWVIFLLIAAFLWVCWDERADRGIRGTRLSSAAQLRGIDVLAFAALIVIITVLTFTSLYVQFTDYGEEIIEGVQGRYFVPVMLPAGLIISYLAGRRSLRPADRAVPAAAETAETWARGADLENSVDPLETGAEAEQTERFEDNVTATNTWWLYPLIGYVMVFTLIAIVDVMS